MMRRFLCFALLFLTLSVPAVFALKEPFDHSQWDQFLKKYVNEKGEVDYAGAKKNPALLEAYLKILSDIEPSEFSEWPREEQMAAFLNAYHAALVRKILEFYPITNTNQIPGLWEMDIVEVGGRHLGLNEIRDKVLSTQFHDEKTQIALSYGARSGPKMSREAFTGEKVDAQLFLAAKNFVNDPEQNQITPGQKKLLLSPLFEWHAKDFIFSYAHGDQGNGYKKLIEFSVLSFLSHYVNDAEKLDYLEEGGYKIKYLKFDRTLNDWKREAGTAPSPAQ